MSGTLKSHVRLPVFRQIRLLQCIQGAQKEIKQNITNPY